jgi:hypothetical protein
MSLLEVKIIEGGDFTPKMKRKRTRKRTGTNGSIDGEKLRPYVPWSWRRSEERSGRDGQFAVRTHL